MASFAHEAAVARRLLDAIGLPYTGVSNPLARYRRETGADVEIQHEGRTVGIQVTDFCADEGIADSGRGLRATEKRNAARGKFPAYPLPLQHQLAALAFRVRDKIEKARHYSFLEFDEVWLLLAGSLSRLDAIVSTSILPQLITAAELNRHLDDALRPSKYERVFLHIQVGDTVYEWTPASRWQIVHGTERSEPTGRELWFKALLPRFP